MRHLQAVFLIVATVNGRLAYLSHMITPWGLGVQQANVDALQKIPTSVDVPRLCIFLGLANYYERFIKNFSLIAKPLTILMSKDQPWTWGCEQHRVFETLKHRLGAALVLWRPNVPKFFCCIRNRVHWIWEQFSFKRINLTGIKLLLMFCKVTILWRPTIHPTKEKCWWQCGLLPISNHIFIVSALCWWLTISLYGGSWNQISLLASPPTGFL